MENTQKAFDKALKIGVDGLECDLQLSREGVPILFHDRTLAKFKFFQKRVKQFSWNEIQTFPKQRYKSWTISGKQLMTYREFLKKYAKKQRLFIELKSRIGDRQDGTSKKLVDSLIKVHKEVFPPVDSSYFMSFDSDLMQYVKKKLSKYNLIQLVEEPLQLKQNLLKGFFGVGLPVQKIDKELVDRCHRWGLNVLVYTCNGPIQLSRMKRAGVDVIVSDRPDWIKQHWKVLSEIS